MDKSIYTYNYGQLLRLLVASRQRVGMTQVDVAKALNETQTFISKCERGERRLDVVELRMWCAALGIRFSSLMQEFEECSLPALRK